MQKGLIKHDFYLFDGVNAHGEGNRNPANTLFYAQNSRFDGGRWSSRMGYEAFGEELTGGTNIKGLIKYDRFPSGIENEYVVSYYGSNFYRHDLVTGVQTQIVPAGWTAADVSVEGTSYNSDLYVGDGINLIGKISDTTFSTVANSPSARLIEEFGEKLWAVDNVAPATAQYSATASASTPANIEDWITPGASGAELIGKGGRIESMRKLNTALYFFKNDSIDRCTGFDLSGANPRPIMEPVTKIGGVLSHRSTIVVENDIWFLTPELEIRSLGQQSGFFQEARTNDLSVVIQRYKSNLDSDQSGAVAVYNKKIYKLWLKEVGSSQNNVAFTYDTNTNLWNFDRSTSPTAAIVVGDSSYFCVDGTSGFLYKDSVGYSDNGFAIGWSGKSLLADDGRPDLSKRARYVYVRGMRSEGVIINAYLVGEDYAKLESFTIPAPTASEIANASSQVGGLNQPPGDIVGDEGYTGTEPGGPMMYRFNYVQSVHSLGRMYGIELQAGLNGGRLAIDEVKLKYIPLPESYYPVNS